MFLVKEGDDPFGGHAEDVYDVLDEFEIADFSNNDGTAGWTSAWKENDPYGGAAAAGLVQIFEGYLILTPPSGGIEPTIEREVDLKSVSVATLSFDYTTSEETIETDALVVEASSNSGAKMTVVDTLTSIVGASSGSRRYIINGFASEHTTIRFRLPASTNEALPFFAIDNVRIDFRYGKEEDEMWVTQDDFNMPFFTNK